MNPRDAIRGKRHGVALLTTAGTASRKRRMVMWLKFGSFIASVTALWGVIGAPILKFLGGLFGGTTP